MPFTVTPTNAPAAAAQPAADAAKTSAQSARERAIAMIKNGGQTSPVQNPSAVSPEELSAIQAPKNTQQSAAPAQTPSTQTNTSETKSEATTQTTQPALSAQYAQLARKEKALRAQVNELKAKEAEIANREEAIKAKDASYQSDYIPKNKLQENLVGTLLDAGYTYDQITQAYLNQPNPQESALISQVKALTAKIADLENETKGTKKSIVDNQQAQYQQAVNQIRNEAKRLIVSDPTFETIKATKNVEEVVSLITKTFEEEGYVMPVEEACSLVEDQLIEEISKYTKLEKIQKKLQAAQAPSAANASAPNKNTEAQQQQSAKTLSNSMATSRPLTAKERAILAFKGQLNKS